MPKHKLAYVDTTNVSGASWVACVRNTETGEDVFSFAIHGREQMDALNDALKPAKKDAALAFLYESLNDGEVIHIEKGTPPHDVGA